MHKEELLDKIAPCSLVCHTCAGYGHGVICEHAGQLANFLEGMGAFYETHRPDKKESFDIFFKELEELGSAKCAGCRNGGRHGCSIQGCFILACTKEHGVDFCGECKKFPCGRTRELFEDEVYLQWLKGNEEIKNLGLEEFWKKNSIKPHYKSYRKP